MESVMSQIKKRQNGTDPCTGCGDLSCKTLKAYILKFGKRRKTILGIPTTMPDRAMQALAFGLRPIAGDSR